MIGWVLQDNVTEYINLLSLLDSCGVDVPKAESSDNLCKLKERLSQYIASEGKSCSSKFVEFWVPSMISNVQLEQYCDTLLSKSMSLCLNSKSDPVGALRETVFSTRKVRSPAISSTNKKCLFHILLYIYLQSPLWAYLQSAYSYLILY